MIRNEDDFIKLDITEEDIISAIEKAQAVRFIDNLRDRHPMVSMESKVRGYLGETGIIKLLTVNGLRCIQVPYDEARGNDLCDIDLAVQGSGRVMTMEIKTSLRPDRWPEFSQIIEQCDIKFIKRTDHIDLDRDVFVQIYFLPLTNENDRQTVDIAQRTGVGPTADARTIYETYGYSKFINGTFFVAWIDKQSQVGYLRRFPGRNTYHIGYRDFWKSGIKYARQPRQLALYLHGGTVADGVLKCPRCGAPMKLRTARDGRQFYGCTNFPSSGCKGSVNMETVQTPAGR
ncbi:MAG: topoisomerase DNA-binding C4 zinc finger domain-containing protein [Ruminococcus sp.]|nr:topoisomerase DNA-binding C4 zinc finger domain-containing protein [Ruminococcus sp.]